MNMIKGVIYCYTSPSDKKYIGQTINEGGRRGCFNNINSKYSGKKFDNARYKYLPENFKYEILETIEEIDKLLLLKTLNNLEQFYIKKYNTFLEGYNSNIGGNSEFVRGEETSNKISKSRSKVVLQYDMDGYFIKEWDSAKTISKEFDCSSTTIAKCCTKKAKKSLGYIWRYKTEDYPLIIETNLSKTDKLVSNSYNYRHVIDGIVYKEVIKYDINGNFIKLYDSMSDAVLENEKTTRTSIAGSCTGRNKTSGGFIWRYRLEDLILSNIDVSNITNNDIVKSKLNKKGEKPVIQYDLQKNMLQRFDSITIATKILDICRTGIYQACTGKLKTYKNFIWEYDI